MMNWLILAAWFFALLVVAPAGLLFAEALLALRPRKHRLADVEAPPVTTTVLVPAHNEATGIGRTIESIQANSPAAEILVIADNCSDDTADLAALAGARVTERFDETRRGKAFALGHGIQTLQADPPAAVAIVDADAKVKGDSLSRVAALAVARNRPMQTLNVIDRSRENRSLSVVTILGNRLHNVVRPLALQRLGFPCLLMGSGMVFPWQMASSVGLENESLGEDKQLGVDMMLAGYAPEFYLETKVASHIAEQGDGYAGQRTRWEQGHLLVALGAIPRLLWQALTRRNLGYLAIALELAVPPIALTALFWMIAAWLALASAIGGGSWAPLALTAAAAALLAATLGITWLGFARRRVPAKSILAVPGYLLRKLPIYVSLALKGPQRVWLKTDRSSPGKSQT
jgi:cellulose synthase/poly-beta-1,6-N-acetylglucosamine synthase-like glycosyltransferase